MRPPLRNVQQRPRRRGLASIGAEIRDGVVPAADGVARTDDVPAAPAGATRNYRTIALIVAVAFFMEQLDATVLTTALPTMAHDFGVPAVNLASALTSYLLALAIFIPASGRMADRFGARTVFRLAIIVFLGGSLLCAQARVLPMLIAARFVQGAGGAMMIPVGRLVLLKSVSKADMVNAMSWLIVPALIGPIIGPPLGGFIVTWLDWRWIFYLNLPVGLVGIGLVTRFIAEIREDGPAPAPDLPGFGLSGVALGCLLFGFEMSSRPGELGRALALIAIGAVAGFAYVRHARRRKDPILDLTLMRIPTFRLSVIAGSLIRITQGAQPFLLPLMLQLGFGMSPAASGMITLAGAVGSLAMKQLAPIALRRFGFRNAMSVNGVIAAACYAACAAFRPDWPSWAIFGVLLVSGFFMSFQFTAYNTIAYDEIEPRRMSSAASFYATFQQLMLSLGVCVGAGVLRLSLLAHHRQAPAPADFSLAFLVVTAISASATFWHLQFAPDAGDQLAGRAPARS